MTREIKFRGWFDDIGMIPTITDIKTACVLMQYTGLEDKNGVEIYELMELNNEYRVLFVGLKYVLQDISSNDIMDMQFNSSLYEITREYSPLQEDS